MNFPGMRLKVIDFICKNYKEVFDSKSEEIQKLDKDVLVIFSPVLLTLSLIS